MMMSELEYSTLEVAAPKKKLSRRTKGFLALSAALLLVGLVAVAWTATGDDATDGPKYGAAAAADAVKTDAQKAKAAFDKEMDAAKPYANTICAVGGLAVLLLGRRLVDPAVFASAALAGGFVASSLLSAALDSWTGMNADRKVILVWVLAALAGLLAGAALAKLRRLGVAALAGTGAFLGGELLYRLTLDPVVNAWWGSYAMGGVLAAVAALVVYRHEDGLLVYLTAASGAAVAAYGGAALFFDYAPTSADVRAHADVGADTNEIYAGKDGNFWLFVAAVAGLFALGLVAQFKICPDPAIERKRRGEERENGFYATPAAETAFVAIDTDLI